MNFGDVKRAALSIVVRIRRASDLGCEQCKTRPLASPKLILSFKWQHGLETHSELRSYLNQVSCGQSLHPDEEFGFLKRNQAMLLF